MIALSDLGRNEKNYLPDAHAMLNSINSDSPIIQDLKNLLLSIMSDFWDAARESLHKVHNMVIADFTTFVFDKCELYINQNLAKL